MEKESAVTSVSKTCVFSPQLAKDKSLQAIFLLSLKAPVDSAVNLAIKLIECGWVGGDCAADHLACAAYLAALPEPELAALLQKIMGADPEKVTPISAGKKS